VLGNTGSFFLFKHLAHDLKLRGKFVFLPSENVLLFLGSPWFIDASEIVIHKLNFAGFAVHSAVVDMLKVSLSTHSWEFENLGKGSLLLTSVSYHEFITG
jgi:hypothetical protein